MWNSFSMLVAGHFLLVILKGQNMVCCGFFCIPRQLLSCVLSKVAGIVRVKTTEINDFGPKGGEERQGSNNHIVLYRGVIVLMPSVTKVYVKQIEHYSFSCTGALQRETLNSVPLKARRWQVLLKKYDGNFKSMFTACSIFPKAYVFSVFSFRLTVLISFVFFSFLMPPTSMPVEHLPSAHAVPTL